MREKHITRLSELALECRKHFHPYDIDFSCCPRPEKRRLLTYEYSRQIGFLRDMVASIRTGTLPLPSYWRASPQFGWPEWPQYPYLSIPPAERMRRIAALSESAPSDPWLAALPILSVGQGQNVVKFPLAIDATRPRAESVRAFAALLEAYKLGRPAHQRKMGRRARRIQVTSRLRGLIVYRLRQHFSAADTITLLEISSLQGLFGEETHLERARRKAERDLCVFALAARESIDAGHWFFPFSDQLLTK